MIEEWKDIIGYEGLYKISNYGQVKSLSRQVGTCFRKERILKNFKNNDGYLSVDLLKFYKRKTNKIHRLVALYFIDNPNNYTEVNHIDGKKENNITQNLEWCTRSQNIKHAFINKLRNHVGENHPQTKLINKQVLEIFKLTQQGVSSRIIAQKFNISRGTVYEIKHKRTWKHLHD